MVFSSPHKYPTPISIYLSFSFSILFQITLSPSLSLSLSLSLYFLYFYLIIEHSLAMIRNRERTSDCLLHTRTANHDLLTFPLCLHFCFLFSFFFISHHCLHTVHALFADPTTLFIRLKIILLQYFQFSILVTISSFKYYFFIHSLFFFLSSFILPIFIHNNYIFQWKVLYP